MTATKKTKDFVMGPSGEVLRLADLPSPTVRRWVPRRKAEVVCAVRGGLLTRDVAMKMYSLSPVEYAEWETHYTTDGLPALRVTHLQEYR